MEETRAIKRAGFGNKKETDDGKRRVAAAFGIFGLFLVFSFPVQTLAATLSIAPSPISTAIGRTFSLNVYVSSTDQPMNAVSGRVIFPTDQLEVMSISKGGSVLNLWVAEPSFSNGAGTVDFEGIAFNPGYQGANGQVISISFRTKSSGSASLSFANASVLANDGQGTEILRSAGGALVNITSGTTNQNVSQPSSQTQNSQSPSVSGKTPSAPTISSPTHPDPNKWYSADTAVFSWNLPKDITAVRLLYGHSPNLLPTINYVPPISKKTIEKAGQGILYLHARFKNASGWGKTAHFKFNIDNVSPNYLAIKEIKQIENGTGTGSGLAGLFSPSDADISVSLEAKDELSGIDRYELKIDEGEWVNMAEDGAGLYKAGPAAGGDHILSVRAFDKADNYIEKTSTFHIDSNRISIPSFELPSALKEIKTSMRVLYGLVAFMILLTWYLHRKGIVSARKVILFPLYVVYIILRLIVIVMSRLFETANRPKSFDIRAMPRKNIKSVKFPRRNSRSRP